MIKNKIIFYFNIFASGAVIGYPDIVSILKLVLCIVVGIIISKAIQRPVKKRTKKQKVSDYLGQAIVSVLTAFIIRRYINLEGDYEFLFVSFLIGMFSYGILELYRWLIAGGIIEIIKSKLKK